MSLFLALITAFSPLPQAVPVSDAAPDETVVVASGKGEYSRSERLNARLNVCWQAIQVGIGPDKLTVWMEAKGFSKDAEATTLDICSALATGVDLGVKASEDAKKNTI